MTDPRLDEKFRRAPYLFIPPPPGPKKPWWKQPWWMWVITAVVIANALWAAVLLVMSFYILWAGRW